MVNFIYTEGKIYTENNICHYLNNIDNHQPLKIKVKKFKYLVISYFLLFLRNNFFFFKAENKNKSLHWETGPSACRRANGALQHQLPCVLS